MKRRLWIWLLAAFLLVLGAAELGTGRLPVLRPRYRTVSLLRGSTAARIVEGARDEVRRGVRYDAAYALISYPSGDVPPDRGACTDVIIRALRRAGYDLQALIHEDMAAHFRAYPPRYGLTEPDPNIDHRRAGNHVVFFRRHGLELPRDTTGAATATWKPGDLVYWGPPNRPFHCGVCSDRINPRGLPWVIHNYGGAREEDCLTRSPIAGHFRFPRG